MQHLRYVTKPAPAKAQSVLLWQQKVAVFAAFATALGAFGNSLGILRDLFGGDDEE